LIALEETRIGGMDSTALGKKVDSLYAEYCINRDMAAKTLRYHQEDIVQWRRFYEKVVKRLELKQQEELHR
jgi:hypothetical protein